MRSRIFDVCTVLGAVVLTGCGTDATGRKAGTGGSGGSDNGGGSGGINVGAGGSVDLGDGGIPSSGGGVVDTTTPFVKDDTGAANLDGPTVTALKMGGSSCSTPVLYPYEGTMFPVGGIAPIIQWKGDADAAYVQMTYGDLAKVSYEFAVASRARAASRSPTPPGTKCRVGPRSRPRSPPRCRSP